MNDLGLFSMDLGLGRMEAFRAEAGLHDAPPVVHVVGTNGKGSTSTFIESIARAHGLKTGLFTSPHFVTPRERIRVNGRILPREDWVRLANRLLSLSCGSRLTYFEFQTSLAMLAFCDAGVDVAVMEAGLGGRFDATNVFDPFLTVFTPIGMDHEAVLGDTLEEIAQDKAGAMREGGFAVTARQKPGAMRVLHAQAAKQGGRFIRSEQSPLPDCPLGLRGAHQRENARLALVAWQHLAQGLGLPPDAEAEATGLKQAFIPGRLQFAQLNGCEVILDGAHNAHALEALRDALDAEGVRPGAVVFGCMADKDIASMLGLLEAVTNGPIFVTRADWSRAASPENLAEALPGRAEALPDIRTALERALGEPGPVLVCGSLYLLGDVYSLYPRLLNPSPNE